MRSLLFALLIGVVALNTACAAYRMAPVVPDATGAVTPTAAALAADDQSTSEASASSVPTMRSSFTPTPNIIVTAVPIPAPTTASLSMEPTSTPTVAPPTIAPSPTPRATSAVVEHWLSYLNSFLGYEFAYPPEASVLRQGVTGFPSAERPENMTDEAYLRQLEAAYPDDLCVTVRYDHGFVAFVPDREAEGRYTVPCGVTGVGDFNVTNVSEAIVLNDEPYTASGWLLHDSAGLWQGEFYFLDVTGTLTVHFGSMSGTEEEFRDTKATLLQIVSSLRVNRSG